MSEDLKKSGVKIDHFLNDLTQLKNMTPAQLAERKQKQAVAVAAEKREVEQ